MHAMANSGAQHRRSFICDPWCLDVESGAAPDHRVRGSGARVETRTSIQTVATILIAPFRRMQASSAHVDREISNRPASGDSPTIWSKSGAAVAITHWPE